MTDEKSKSSDRLALVVGAAIALALVAWGISWAYSSIVLEVQGVEADGQIEYVSFSRGTAEHPNRTYCHLTVKLPGESDGHLTLHTDSETCASMDHTTLRVRYVPGDPDNSRPASEGGILIDIAVLVTVGFALFLVARVVLAASRKLRKMRADAASSRSR